MSPAGSKATSSCAILAPSELEAVTIVTCKFKSTHGIAIRSMRTEASEHIVEINASYATTIQTRSTDRVGMLLPGVASWQVTDKPTWQKRTRAEILNSAGWGT